MAWRIGQSVVKGEIDNRTHGQVVGRIWLMGRPQPLVLKLSGNCLRDIAGSMLTFENPSPVSGDAVDLGETQEGSAGDITASRKVRILDVPFEEAQKMWDAGRKPPEHVGNSLYLEWFSQRNGRVVVEGPDFTFTVSEPVWRMTEAEEVDQAMANRRAIEDWMASVKLPRPEPQAQGLEELFDEDLEADAAHAMDEFEWEKSLKESDRLTDKYSALLDQYMDHPDRDRIIAREMGWSWLEDALDSEKDVLASGAREGEQPDVLEDDEDSVLEPDPAAEGVDWIRTENGRVTHPLAHRAMQAANRMWRVCDGLGLMSDERQADVQEMVFSSQTLSAKLAGALDGLARGAEMESGFVVACLKRALKHVQAAAGALARVRPKQVIEPDMLDGFHHELFAIREEMLRLMKQHRQRIM